MLKKISHRFIFNPFFKNVAVLLSWSLLAQLLSFVMLPIISRLYDPFLFGELASFISIVSLLTMLSTGRFEMAIMLPKRKEEAVSLVVLIIVLSFVFSLFYLGIVSFFPINLIDHRVLLLIPIYTFLYGVWTSLSYYLNRTKKFNILGVSKVIQSVIVALFSVLFSYYTSRGLILAIIIGLITSLIFIFLKVKDEIFSFSLKFEYIRNVFHRYIDFLKFSTLSGVFNSLSNVGLPLLISMFFNPVLTGLYFFSNKIIKIPLNLMFSSLSQVFFQKASILYNEMSYTELLKFTVSIQKKIALLIIPFLVLMSFISPWLFGFIFGKEWIEAGEYVKYFAFFVFMNSLISPISSLMDIFEKQKLELYFNVSLGLSQLLGLWIGSSIFNSFDFSLIFISVVGGLHYLGLNIYIHYKLRRLSINSSLD